MIYHFPTEFIYQNSYFPLRIQKHPSQRLGNLFKINLFSVYCNSVESQLRRPFVTSSRVRNANPHTNAYFIAFVISEHAVLKNWFIHLAIYTKTNKCYSLILMALCYSMITFTTASCSNSYAIFCYEKPDSLFISILVESLINVHQIARKNGMEK